MTVPKRTRTALLATILFSLLCLAGGADELVHTYNSHFSLDTMVNVESVDHSVKLMKVTNWWDPAYSPDWWDENYRFRRQTTVINRSGTDTIYSGFPVKLKLDVSDKVVGSKMREDLYDLRMAYMNVGTGNWSEVDIWPTPSNGIRFGGSSLTVPVSAFSGLSDATVEFWFSRRGTWDNTSTGNQTLFCAYEDASNYIKIFFAEVGNGEGVAAGTISVHAMIAGVQAFAVQSLSTVWPMDEWHHLSLVLGTGGAILSIDGEMQGNDASSVSFADFAPVNVTLGSEDDADEYYFGSVDEFRLSSSRRYSGEFTPSETPFLEDGNSVAIYHLDEMAGPDAFDATSNNNNANGGMSFAEGFIKQMAGNYSEVWFQTAMGSSIAPGEFDDNYYIYYGNPAAANPGVDAGDGLTFVEDFTSDPETNGNWNVLRYQGIVSDECYWDSVDKVFELTSSAVNRGGAIYYPDDLSAMDSWEIEFDFFIGNGAGTGARGMAFVFYDKGTSTVYGPSLADAGSFTWAVEFDGYQDPDDLDGDHIAIVRNNGLTTDHLVTVSDMRVEDSTWHTAKIRLVGSRMTVTMDRDAAPVIDFEIPSFVKSYGMFGFNASTSSAVDTNMHLLSDITFRRILEQEPRNIVGGEMDRLDAFNEWQFRYPVTVTNTSGSAELPEGSLVNVSLDHAALVSAGQSLASGDDIRVVYYSAGQFVEVMRNVATWNTSAVDVEFRTVRAIGPDDVDSGYYLYFNNPNADVPTFFGWDHNIFYDDFSSYGVDTRRWLVNTTLGITFQNISGEFTMFDAIGSAGLGWMDANDTTGSQFQALCALPGDYEIEWQSTMDDTVAAYSGQGGAALVDSGSLVHAFLGHVDDDSTLFAYRYALCENSDIFDAASIPETVDFRLVKDGMDVYSYVDDVLLSQSTLTGDVTAVSMAAGALVATDFVDYIAIDNFTIRPYFASAPLSALGAYEGPFYLTGSLTSPIEDMGDVNSAVENVEWTQSGTGGSLTIQIRANNDYDWLSANPEVDWYTVVTSGENPPSFGKYLQYRAIFASPGTMQGPVLDDITIGYNLQPITPVNSYPLPAGEVSTTQPVLMASSFIDSNGDAHYASRWQIRLASGSYASPVWDSGPDTSNLLSVTVPEQTLSDGNTYYWHVAYCDENYSWTNSWSEYSNETTFIVNLGGSIYNDAPDAPELDLPATGYVFETKTPTLTWLKVSTPMGVTYVVQVDKTGVFAGGLDYTASLGVNYATTENLYNGTYYWRVRAVSGMQNEGPWSPVRLFVVDVEGNDAPTSSTVEPEATPDAEALPEQGSEAKICFLGALIK